jgi:hypothetical protein
VSSRVVGRRGVRPTEHTRPETPATASQGSTAGHLASGARATQGDTRPATPR